MNSMICPRLDKTTRSTVRRKMFTKKLSNSPIDLSRMAQDEQMTAALDPNIGIRQPNRQEPIAGAVNVQSLNLCVWR